MKNSVFDYDDYKDYVRDALDARAENKRGERSRLASFVGCHTAYVSQVLNGAAHFSLEQAEKINHFLGHGKEQSLFFLFLIQLARAGTPSLRKVFEEQLRALKEKQFVLKDRLQFNKTLSREDQATFYSSWHYGAAHVLVSVPHEPLWRAVNMARGAYWRQLGNTPGHVNHFSKRAIVSLCARHGDVIETRSPFPWTMVLVRV